MSYAATICGFKSHSVKGQGTEMPARDRKPLPQKQLREILAGWLRHGLAERGWSQVDLAANVAGVGREAINKIAQARTMPDDETIQKLAHALGVDPPTLAADPFHLGVGDRAWLRMMAERYRRAAEALPPDVPDVLMEPAPTSASRAGKLSTEAAALSPDVQVKGSSRRPKPKPGRRTQRGP